MKNRLLLSWILIFAFFLFNGKPAQAVMDLSVVPVEGGGTIRFSRTDLRENVTHDVRIRITSNDGVQYQVFQQLVSPLMNERGRTIERPALMASIVPGSGGSGTPYLSTFEPIGHGEQLLYTSSPSGISESFTLVYKVDPQYLTDSGNFSGLLQFTIRPVSGGQRQTVQANVFIESIAELEVKAEGSSGVNLVRVDSKSKTSQAYANLEFSGNLGGAIRVYQEVLIRPVNELNSELESDILKLFFSGGQQGDLVLQGPVDLPRNRTLIYKSSQQSDSFSVGYQLVPEKLTGQRTGSYRGVVRFSFETDQFEKSFDVDLDIKISPLFEIVTSFPQGPISFSGILPGTDPQIKEVNVKVNTNLGKPYTVIQSISQLLANDRGQEIPKTYFTMREELLEGSSGRAATNEFRPVEVGEKVIFYSDERGSPSEFKVFYQLSPFEQMQPGDYRTAILYTLGEL